MYLVLAGTLLVILKFADVAPVAGWSWWGVLLPFGLAVLWWAWSDATGRTKRLEMDKMEDRKEQRRRKAYEALGIDYRHESKNRKKAEAFKRMRETQIQKVEGKRDEVRKQHADTITRASQFHSEVPSTGFDGLEEPAAKK